MSRVHKKETTGYKKEAIGYKFDTSTKNLACFIHSSKDRRRPRRKSKAKLQFQQEIFLQNILTNVLQQEFAPSELKELIATSRKQTCYTKESDEEINLNEEDNYKSIIRSCSKEQYTSPHSDPTSSATPTPSASPNADANTTNKTNSKLDLTKYHIRVMQIEQDGRTTLMIRHIPNKYTEEMLLEEINKNHKFRYNFLYLPIDQYNSCNVGYAFVNFIHTKFILSFYQEFNGKKWNKFNSEKICELAYARIQGTTNLIDHFQQPNCYLEIKRKSSSQDSKTKTIEEK